jgi:hypothetical protein
MFRKVPLLAICALAVLAGCKKEEAPPAPATPTASNSTPAIDSKPTHEIVGTWDGTDSDPKFKAVFVFSPDGTFTDHALSSMKGMESPLLSVVKGTYKFRGDTMNLKYKDIQFSSDDKSVSANLEEKGKEISAKDISAFDATLDWKDDDTVVMTTPDGPDKKQVTTLKRQAPITPPTGDSSGGSNGTTTG